MARSFVGSVVTVAGGTAVAQAIALAALPVITRLYPPEVYGVFVVFLAWGGIVAPVVCARFDAAIVLPRRARSASAVAVGSLGVAIGMTALTGLAVAVLSATTTLLDGHGALALPLFVLLGGALQVLWNWSARTGDFRRLSISRIAQAAVTALLSIGLAFAAGASATVLILATLAGQAAALAVLTPGLPGSGFDPRVRPQQVWRLLRHFRRLAFFNGPHVLSDAAQNSGLPLLVASFFGAHAAAYFGFAIRLLKAPMGLVSGAVAQVYYPRAAAHRGDDARLRRDALRLLAGLGAGAAVALPLLLLLPDRLFATLFGAAWADAGGYLRALAPWIVSAFVAGPLGVLYLVKQRVGLDFALALGGTALAFGLFIGAQALSGDVLWSLRVLSIGMAVYIALTMLGEFVFVIGRRRDV
jgi:O-antigen/teichoic acid export membrane protein